MKKEEKLKSLDNEKLIDIVKNFRQYGYDESLRKLAILTLKERGIDENYLQLTGNFTNTSYDSAQNNYTSFIQNSKKAFILFIVVILTNILISIAENISELIALIMSIILLISVIFYMIFLIRSFINQNQFYKTLGQDYGTEGALTYFFLGMPFYFIMFFYFRNQMKEKMNSGNITTE